MASVYVVLFFYVICVFCLLVVLVRLSVPVQVIDWKDSSPKWYVLMRTLNSTNSLTHPKVLLLLHVTTGSELQIHKDVLFFLMYPREVWFAQWCCRLRWRRWVCIRGSRVASVHQWTFGIRTGRCRPMSESLDIAATSNVQGVATPSFTIANKIRQNPARSSAKYWCKYSMHYWYYTQLLQYEAIRSPLCAMAILSIYSSVHRPVTCTNLCQTG